MANCIDFFEEMWYHYRVIKSAFEFVKIMGVKSYV